MIDIPFAALRALVAIRQDGGIRPAARRLGVSPSALHRHLRELEAAVGVELTQSGLRTVRLTAAGERLARAAAEGVNILAGAVEAAREDRSSSRVVISTTHSFAARWLLPRLPSLREQHPRIEVSLYADTALNPPLRDAGFSIRMGAGPWPDAVVEPLMEEVILPVMSPTIRGRLGNVTTPDEIARMRLLHDRDRQASWRRWANAFDVSASAVRRGDRFASSDLLLEAASLGMGVAMGRLRLAEAAIKRGRLVPIESLAAPIGVSYWLVAPAEPTQAEGDFASWIRHAAAAG